MIDLVQSLSESFPAIPRSLPVARRAVTALAADACATPEQIADIRLAVSEAVTNVILHAYGNGAGAIHLAAAVLEGELWVLIGDDGGGLRSRSGRSGLGLGLALIAQASDELTIVNRSGGGTELRMRFRLDVVEAPAVQAPAGGREVPAGLVAAVNQSRGSVLSAISPASSSFSTTA